MPAKPSVSRVPAPAASRNGVAHARNGTPAATPPMAAKAAAKPEHKILFQKYFKSIGPRTYAVQLKEANNGNHYLVLTEGKRDLETGEVKKTKLFVYSEDFGAYFRMLHETAQFIKTHPVAEEIKQKRQRYWAKKEAEAATAARVAAERQAAAAAAKPIHPTKVTAPKNGSRRPARGR
ncbi:MAG TPA: DUF3276 family protein [Ardenticatenaceae bacterium]|nr:DUF3276 family protein [Ardenticatenaceae bacterium]